MERKFDYKNDTENGKKLQGFTVDEVLQAGWYAIMSRKEQNEKQKKIMALAKNDPRFKGILDTARKQLKSA